MINYDLTKIKLIVFDVDGVLSSSTVGMRDDGQPQRTVNVKDGYAINYALRMGLPVAIITGGNMDSVRHRYEGLGCHDVHLGCSIKLGVYEQLLHKYNLTDENVMYMGDDLPDYPVMQRCGCPCCPSDASPEIQNISLYVSHHPGGQGCGRDVIEQVLKAQSKWMTPEAFKW